MNYTLASGISYKRAGRLDLLELYIKNGFDINQRGKPLILGAYTTPKATADKLESWGKTSGTFYAPLNCELTLLHVATITSDEESEKWLLEHGATKDAKGVCFDLMGRKAKPFSVFEISRLVNQ